MTMMTITGASLRRIRRIAFLGFAVAIGLSACVLNPTNLQTVTPSQPIPFSGYGSVANAKIEILAFNKKTQQWDQIGSATTQNSPADFNGDLLYPWSTSIRFDTLPNWECYWLSSCQINGGGAHASVKVRQGQYFLTTFDQDGVDCLEDEIQAGEGGFTAGYNCQGENSPVIELNWVF